MDTQKGSRGVRGADVVMVSWLVAAALLIGLGWLGLSGCVSPPTRTEKLLFDIKTNHVEQVTGLTNVFAIDDVAVGLNLRTVSGRLND